MEQKEIDISEGRQATILDELGNFIMAMHCNFWILHVLASRTRHGIHGSHDDESSNTRNCTDKTE